MAENPERADYPPAPHESVGETLEAHWHCECGAYVRDDEECPECGEREEERTCGAEGSAIGDADWRRGVYGYVYGGRERRET